MPVAMGTKHNIPRRICNHAMGVGRPQGLPDIAYQCPLGNDGEASRRHSFAPLPLLSETLHAAGSSYPGRLLFERSNRCRDCWRQVIASA
jgi:hypothetical protein